jgi:hypothetical protein
MVYPVPPTAPAGWTAPLDCACSRCLYPVATDLPSTVSDSETYVATRDDTAQRLYATAYDRILSRQGAHADQQRARRLRRRRGGKALKDGDLAYLLTRTGGFEPTIQGPFVVTNIGNHTVDFRTTQLVEGQPFKSFSVHVERVARCTTITDVLEDLLKQAQIVQQALSVDPDTADTAVVDPTSATNP